ncbi:DUF2570 family protein [uncultured Serratia sp.]|uniref:DUF2570 family protein n=1 Tax=uncultured Serratia sp. TaxID=239175 RepID=UPI002586D63A|nr:DUF2570 family protein [uncultured Serratia sp.]
MKPSLILGAASIVLVSVLCAVVSYYHDKSDRLVSEVKQQEKTLAQQSGLISALQAQDRKNRVLAAEQQQREQQLRQQGETYQRKLRDALKGSKCGNSPMPAAVVELLQQNAAGTSANRPVAP